MTFTRLVNLIAILLVGFSCSDSDINHSCPDPIGSDYYVVQHGSWICFMSGYNGCFYVDLDTTPATPTFKSIIIPNYVAGTITDVGTIDCLGKLIEKPTSGFTTAAEAKLNHGYVVTFPDNTFGRFYIDAMVKNSSGKVTKIHISRQYEF